MAVELSTETLTEEGGADGTVCVRKRERESQNRLNCVELHSPAAIVVPSAISC